MYSAPSSTQNAPVPSFLIWIISAGVLAVGCGGDDDGDPHHGMPPGRLTWMCPPRWVEHRDGGCGPAVLLCAPGGDAAEGACAGENITLPNGLTEGDGSVGGTFWRTATGGIGGAWPEQDMATG